MPERFNRAERSRIMAAVHSTDTRPEVAVRRIVHSLGYRFRLHRRDLPGTPDIVLPRLKTIINVHGCFWHLHACPHSLRAPVNNADYWKIKRSRNAARDRKNLRQLRSLGWRVLTLWECEMTDPKALRQRVRKFLGSGQK